MKAADGLAVADQVAHKLITEEWRVLAVAGGLALNPAARTFLRGFEIKASKTTVVIICDRKPKK